jgi:hypothetical protein
MKPYRKTAPGKCKAEKRTTGVMVQPFRDSYHANFASYALVAGAKTKPPLNKIF